MRSAARCAAGSCRSPTPLAFRTSAAAAAPAPSAGAHAVGGVNFIHAFARRSTTKKNSSRSQPYTLHVPVTTRPRQTYVCKKQKSLQNCERRTTRMRRFSSTALRRVCGFCSRSLLLGEGRPIEHSARSCRHNMQSVALRPSIRALRPINGRLEHLYVIALAEAGAAPPSSTMLARQFRLPSRVAQRLASSRCCQASLYVRSACRSELCYLAVPAAALARQIA